MRTSGQPLGRPFPAQHSWNGTRPENSARPARVGAIGGLETGKGLSSARIAAAQYASGLGRLTKQETVLSEEVLVVNAAGGKKFDGGKSPVYQGFVQYFPRAIRAVADISAFGAKKYNVPFEDQNWARVAVGQFEDAMARHTLDHAKGEVDAQDSKLKHLAHRAWNAMATLELALREEEKNVIA